MRPWRASFLARAKDFSGKIQREIAREARFPKPNVLSMMKKGQTRAPIDRVPALATACHVDPAYFLRLALPEYHRAVWQVIIDAIGQPLTASEWDMVHCYRIVAPENEIEMDPRVTTAILDTLTGVRMPPTPVLRTVSRS